MPNQISNFSLIIFIIIHNCDSSAALAFRSIFNDGDSNPKPFHWSIVFSFQWTNECAMNFGVVIRNLRILSIYFHIDHLTVNSIFRRIIFTLIHFIVSFQFIFFLNKQLVSVLLLVLCERKWILLIPLQFIFSKSLFGYCFSRNDYIRSCWRWFHFISFFFFFFFERVMHEFVFGMRVTVNQMYTFMNVVHCRRVVYTMWRCEVANWTEWDRPNSIGSIESRLHANTVNVKRDSWLHHNRLP